MGVQIDLIIPPVIIGLLIIMIFRLNAFIMETSVDNRLNNDMQMFADLTSRLIQEELKSADQILQPDNPAVPDTILSFVRSVSRDTVIVQKSGRNLEMILKSSNPSVLPDTLIYPSSLSSLSFDLERKPVGEITPYYLNVRIETESNPDHHASQKKENPTVRAFAENEIYLRNVHRNSSP